MAAMDHVRVLSRFGLKVTTLVAPVAPLLTRLIIGWAFYEAGRGKLGNLEGVTDFFASLGIPAPGFHAWFIANLECWGGLLLMIGLLTRPVALLLGATMLVALLTADRPDLFEAWSSAAGGAGEKSFTDVVPLVYGTFMAWLAFYGPGILSLDTLLRRWMGVDRPDADAKPAPATDEGGVEPAMVRPLPAK